MKKLFKKHKYTIFLTLITLVLFFTNYKPQTYLLGWDSLATGLNPWLAVKRAIFSVWEEYQSFGLTAGMAHASDLPRAFFVFLLSFVLPQNLIRYFFHFFMLYLGSLGAYKLFNFFFKEKKEWLAFLGGVFYLLNFGTVQIFFLPFEPFSSFFALLPWGILVFLKLYFSKPDDFKKNLLIFSLGNFLGTPSFYTQQIFIVYLLALGCFAFILLLKYKSWKSIKRLVIAFLLIFAVNSYWILPQVYFLKNHVYWVKEAKANQIATRDVFSQNYEKGTLKHFMNLEGLYYDLNGIKRTPLFADWKENFVKNGFNKLSYLFFSLAIIGLISTLFRKRLTDSIPQAMLLLALLSATALLIATPPFSWINFYLRKIAIINQIFRSPFTKFISFYALTYSYFLVRGILFLTELTSKIVKNKNLAKSINLITFFTLFIAYSFPSFKGFFISPEMKVKIPEDYFKLIDYFKKEDKTKRIALAPNYTFWGWYFTKWGYNGSGFLWYAIEQPIVSRTFDVWSEKSESYFWEIKTAIESEDLTKFENVLEKYNINYLLVDYSLIPIVGSYKTIAYDRLNNFLSKSKIIKPVLKTKYLVLFKVNLNYPTQKFISIASNLKNIGPEILLTDNDTAYFENKTYISSPPYQIYYPFLDLTTYTRIKNKRWEINENKNSFIINTKLDIEPKNYNLYLPSSASAVLFYDGQPKHFNLKLNYNLADKKLKITFNKILLNLFKNQNSDAKTSLDFWAENLSHRYSYLVKIEHNHTKGSPLFTYSLDTTKQQVSIEDYLLNNPEYFILPNKSQHGLAYSFTFVKKDYKNYPSHDEFKNLSIYLFPYKALKTTKFIKKDHEIQSLPPKYFNDFEAEKHNYFYYKVKLSKDVILQNPTLILYQQYDPGWIAFLNGKKLQHTIVNNWANGWKIGESNCKNTCQITIIFRPQILEFIGFLMNILVFIIILIFYKNPPKI